MFQFGNYDSICQVYMTQIELRKKTLQSTIVLI